MSKSRVEEMIAAMSTTAMSVPDCMRFYESRTPEQSLGDAFEAVKMYEEAIDEAKVLMTQAPDLDAFRSLAVRTQRHALLFGNLAVLELAEKVAGARSATTSDILTFKHLIDEMHEARTAIRVLTQFCLIAGRDICGRPLGS